MPVNFFVYEASIRVKRKSVIKKWISEIIDEYSKRRGTLNIILTNDKNLLKLNKSHLSSDYLTDIITFNFNQKNTISGDIYISVERVRENSEKYKVSFSSEMQRVIIHGILHLLGFDDNDQKDKEIMKRAEDAAILKIQTIENFQ